MASPSPPDAIESKMKGPPSYKILGLWQNASLEGVPSAMSHPVVYQMSSKCLFRPNVPAMRSAFGGAPVQHQRSPVCKHCLPCEHTRAFVTCRAAAGAEASTSGSGEDNIPTLLKAMLNDLPSTSKMRKVLEATQRLLTALKTLTVRDKESWLEGKRPQKLPMLASALTTAVLPSGGWSDLGHNFIFQAGFWGWLIAQCLKVFTKRYKQGIWDIKAMVDSGGMPSSHSSLTAAVTTAVALEFGLGSSLFAVALCFTVITMYDATGVRRHAGKQAEVLNILLRDVVQGHPISDRKLKEMLGHTPLQVVSGAILGVIVACFVPSPPGLGPVI